MKKYKISSGCLVSVPYLQFPSELFLFAEGRVKQRRASLLILEKKSLSSEEGFYSSIYP